MRRLAIFSSLVLALALAAPAGAQIAERHRYEPISAPDPFIGDGALPGPGIGRELRDLRKRIGRARDSGAITRREARRLRRETRLIGHLASRYGRDGLSASERREIEARAASLRSLVAAPGG